MLGTSSSSAGVGNDVEPTGSSGTVDGLLRSPILPQFGGIRKL